eukprot:COSAG04_NODE_9522_length_855_cov_39.972222_2_plen_163_part_00
MHPRCHAVLHRAMIYPKSYDRASCIERLRGNRPSKGMRVPSQCHPEAKCVEVFELPHDEAHTDPNLTQLEWVLPDRPTDAMLLSVIEFEQKYLATSATATRPGGAAYRGKAIPARKKLWMDSRLMRCTHCMWFGGLTHTTAHRMGHYEGVSSSAPTKRVFTQ